VIASLKEASPVAGDGYSLQMDNNLDGTYETVHTFRWANGGGAGTQESTISGYVAPGGRYVFNNLS